MCLDTQNILVESYNTLGSIYVHAIDRTPPEKKKGVVNDNTCNGCGKQYTGETARALGDWMNTRSTGRDQNPSSSPWTSKGKSRRLFTSNANVHR